MAVELNGAQVVGHEFRSLAKMIMPLWEFLKIRIGPIPKTAISVVCA